MSQVWQAALPGAIASVVNASPLPLKLALSRLLPLKTPMLFITLSWRFSRGWAILPTPFPETFSKDSRHCSLSQTTAGRVLLAPTG